MQRLRLPWVLRMVRSSRQRLASSERAWREQERRTRELEEAGAPASEVARDLLNTLEQCASTARARLAAHEHLAEALAAGRIHIPSLLVAVVDDEPGVTRALARLLEADGFRVESFGNGSDFLAALPSLAPDCAVIDAHMRGLGGAQVLQALRAQGHAVPVVVLTGDVSPAVKERMLALGAAAFLRKPADEHGLLDAVHAALQRTRPVAQ